MEKKRILIIDNDRDSRNALDELLLAAGYEVLLTADGLEAMDLFASTPPDLVVTEVDLPGLNGQGVLACINKDWPAVPVIVFTEFATPENEQEFRHLGARDFLSKTLGPDAIQARIAHALKEGD